MLMTAMATNAALKKGIVKQTINFKVNQMIDNNRFRSVDTIA